MTALKNNLITTTTDGVPGYAPGVGAVVAARMEPTTIQQGASEVVFRPTAPRLA